MPTPTPTSEASRPGPLLAEVVTLGECLVSMVAAEAGPLAEVGSFRRHVAGAEANVAVGLARLGRRVAYIGCVGDDGFGTAIMRRLRGESVDVGHMRIVVGARTGVMFRERRAAGPSEVVYHRAGSAGSQLGPDDVAGAVEAGVFRTARHLHLTGITPALSPSCLEAFGVAIAAARSSGLTISLDLNLRRRLWTDAEAARVLRTFIAGCDLVFASLEEGAVVAETAAKAEPLDVARALVALGVRHAVLKLGSDGAASLGPDETWTSAPAVPSVPVIDPVGAGDAFCAGYLAAMLEGLGESARLGLGNACGASVLAAEGDLTGAPTRAEADLLGRLSAEQSIR